MTDKEAFREAVYTIVRMIPAGRASSYGAVAHAAGYPGRARLVGHLMAGASEQDIPAHRVVNSQGVLSGKVAFGTGDEMQRLLEAEGIVVRHDRISDWKAVFWNPLLEIRL